MFIGHFGVGFAAKRLAPRMSLGTAFLAAQWLDLLWPTLLLLGLESVRVAPGATAAGVWLYARSTRARDKVGRYGLIGLVGFLALIYAGNRFGDPPPSATAIAWVGQAQWLFVAWAYWVDAHREPQGAATSSRATAAVT